MGRENSNFVPFSHMNSAERPREAAAFLMQVIQRTHPAQQGFVGIDTKCTHKSALVLKVRSEALFPAKKT